MTRRILVIQAHPDSSAPHLCHALADSYAHGASQAGHEVRRLTVAALDFPLLHTQADWEKGEVPQALRQAQEDIKWANHIAFFFPLWLGEMPAMLKAFLEQVARPGFAFDYGQSGAMGMRKGLKGRSARLVVTMGMPALVYRWFFGAHGIRSLERNILRFVGIAPVRWTLVGRVGQVEEARARRLFAQLHKLGAQAR